MKTAITEGIKIKVTTQFRPDLSLVEVSQFFFNYRITIENLSEFKVQLMHREWFIFDSLNDATNVSGEGVVGEQPILNPGEKFTYTSGSELFSEMGYMTGYYLFKNLDKDSMFRVTIPDFYLIYPPKLN